MAFIEPMHRNKPNITYLLTYFSITCTTGVYILPALVCLSVCLLVCLSISRTAAEAKSAHCSLCGDDVISNV